MCLCVVYGLLCDGVCVLLSCVVLVCVIVYKVLGCCVCELLCGDVCWLIAVFLCLCVCLMCLGVVSMSY